MQHARYEFPDQVLNPCPLLWDSEAQTTWLLGVSYLALVSAFIDYLELFYSSFGAHRSLPYKSIIDRTLKCPNTTNVLKEITSPAFIPFIHGLLNMVNHPEEEKKELVQVMARTFLPSTLACLCGPYILGTLVWWCIWSPLSGLLDSILHIILSLVSP